MDLKTNRAQGECDRGGERGLGRVLWVGRSMSREREDSCRASEGESSRRRERRRLSERGRVQVP